MNVDYTPANERQRVQRLRTLIERSKIYTSILADKLLNQQTEAKERGEELDRQRRLEENKVKKEATIAAGATRKSSRVAVANQSENQPQDHISPKKARAAKGTKKKGGKMNIANYFDKKELETNLSTTDALKQAQEDMGDAKAEITAITKPSASARQPELVTGCVLRDYQVHYHLKGVDLSLLVWNG
jgi:ATP-dependent DNA helicase